MRARILFRTWNSGDMHKQRMRGNSTTQMQTRQTRTTSLRKCWKIGTIDRRAHCGFGTPSNGESLFNDMALFGKPTQRWNCTPCDYSRGKYQRYQVFGYIAATHGYTSRVPSERWRIPPNDKYTDLITKPKPMNLNPLRFPICKTAE